MLTTAALQELITQNEKKVQLQKRQLADHDAGINKLSRVVKASTETSLEKAEERLAEYRGMLEELKLQDPEVVAEKERRAAAIERKKYFDNQKSRIKNKREVPSDQKLEAMMIIDELPGDIQFEDEELLDIASKSIELSLRSHDELKDELARIKSNFKTLLKDAKDAHLADIGMLSYRIPIVVLQMSVLLFNIKKEIEEINKKAAEEEAKDQQNSEKPKEGAKEPQKKETEKKEKKVLTFKGFPKYEDWWIQEMWSSHQAYFALYKWKSIITNLCMTAEQKKAWNVIFDGWIYIKEIINSKAELAYEYNFAFDTLMSTYGELEEELSYKNLVSMEQIIKRITMKEDFSKVQKYHNIETPYLDYKRKKLNFRER